MVDKGLLNYVKQQIKSGYSTEQIKIVLLRSGYSPEVIDSVIRQAQQHRKPLVPILIALVIIITASIVSLMYLTEPSPSEALLSVTVSPKVSSVTAGASLPFTASITNPGQQQSINLNIVYQVKNSDNRVISTKQEDKNLMGGSMQITSEIQVPVSANPGAYTLQVSAYYNSKQSSSSGSFEVTAAETVPSAVEIPEQPIDIVELKCPDSCDDNNRCTNDFCSSSTNYLCQNTPIVPCCGNRKCDYGEDYLNCPGDCFAPEPEGGGVLTIDEHVRIKVQESTQSAVDYCQSQKAEDDINTCYYSLADALQQSGPCDNIISEISRDNCYTEYGVLLDDYSVCAKLTNRYLKQSCEQLRDIKSGEIV